MQTQRGKRQKASKGKLSVRQKNLRNRLTNYAKLVGAEGEVKLSMLPKRFGGFNRPGSGKRT